MNSMVYLKCRNCVVLFFALTALGLHAAMAQLRSDSIDILHIRIHLDITDFTGKQLRGYSEIQFTPKMSSISNLNLDLLKLNIDSIVFKGANVTALYNDTLLRIPLGQAYSPLDTLSVRVYYHGQPQIDQLNWGGFYFQSGFAFNLGVGFGANPHNYGRVWFPCFDNFVERSTYTFEITTSGGRKAYCNGELTREIQLSGDTVERTWEMHESIPSYLACVAVADYADVKWTHSGISSNIPVWIAVRQSDTLKLKNSFIHLDDAIRAYEMAYGSFRFNKVGYSIVPFNGGAMEHATNITYPQFAITGNIVYENLMAHELSHHWWGDLVTCDSQDEMWINEGMASYSEHLFAEYLYGRKKYIELVKANHLRVIQYAHIKEGKYRAIMGIPHEYTYGEHVYHKGAAMVHNLRTYLGDSLFYYGLTSFLNDFAYRDVNSALLRDKLSQYTGIALNDFFDDWVFGPGYADFEVDSMKVSPGPAQNNVEVFIHQKKRGSDHYFNNVPMTVSFYDEKYNEIDRRTFLSGEISSMQFSLPILPKFVALNVDDRLNFATTADQNYISEPGNFIFDNGKMNVTVLEVQDSVFLRVEHHWAEGDKNTDPSYEISDYRYWRVGGIFKPGFRARASLTFDGRNIVSGGEGNLDNDLLKNGTDDIILMYRPDRSRKWQEFRYYNKITFGTVPFGRMDIDSLVPGEYIFANGQSTLGLNKVENRTDRFHLSPNPAIDNLVIEDLLPDSVQKRLLIFDSGGRQLMEKEFRGPITVEIGNYKNGVYFAVILSGQYQVFSGQFVVSR